MGNINQKPPGKNGDQETLIDKEMSTWDINSHALNIAPGTEDQVQGFKNKSKLFICSKTIQLTRKYDYKHFFVTDKKIVLELVERFTRGAFISKFDYKVNISDFIESDDIVEEAVFTMNKEVRKRMLQVVGPGNFNFSLVFRNSEHMARYIQSGAWISHQMTQDSMKNDSIRKIFDSHMSDEQKKLINTPPAELITDEEGSMEIIHAELSDHVQYEQQTRLILSEDKDAQNIVFVGPTGCGKSNLVNQLYNKKVVISKASASSVTRKMQFTQGDYKGRKCNIVDTIGLCDTVLSETEVYDLIKDSIRANMVYIDKVVIVCSGRIERAHKEAVKNIMNWLDYEHNKENFVFLYNKSDNDSEDTRQQNLVIMCEEFDISIEQTVNIHSPNGSSLPVKCVQALGLKPGLELSEVASDLTNFRRILISEPTSRINVNVPITRDKTDIIALLALLKQKDQKDNELKKALSQQKEDREKDLKDSPIMESEPPPSTEQELKAEAISMAPEIPNKKTNILILGETGVGKSTWINSFANYLYFEDLQAATDSNETVAVIPSKFSFTSDSGECKDIIIGAEDGNENFDPGQSATQEPITHSFHVHNEVINLIDTPGIGDSRGVDQDKKNFESILDHLSYIDEIHAICILLKPNSSRLTVMFRFCIQQLLAHLHKDATRNIVFCFTHARGNFYKPGDTLPALRQELLERKVDIEVKRETMYCFDSEAFRFLACIKNGVEFEPEDTQVFAASWTRAVKEKNRLFSHIKSLTPHKVLDTLSMNDTRRMICAMSRPLGEMTVTIQKNITQATEAQEKAKLADLEALDFMKDLHVDGIDCEFKELDHPRTVCTHKDCIEYIATGRDNIKQVNYKTHCHPHCGLSGVPSEAVGDSRLQSCVAMAPTGVTCNVCGHSFNHHMHRTYDLVIISRKFISPAVEMKIQNKKDAKSQLEAYEAYCNNLVKEFEHEKETVFRISATYGSFLKDVAIIPYNDALGDYLDMNIAQEREKDKILRNQGLIDSLQTSKEAYEEEKKIIEDAMASSVAGATGRFTPSQIKKLQGELFNLKHFGNSLKVIFESIDGSKRNKYIASQILAPAPLGEVKWGLQQAMKSAASKVKKMFVWDQTEEDGGDMECIG